MRFEQVKIDGVDRLKSGRVILPKGSLESLAHVDKNDPEYGLVTIGSVFTRDGFKTGKHQDCGCLVIDWLSKGRGFGELSIRIMEDGSFKCDDEGMGKEFVQDVFSALVDKLGLKTKEELNQEHEEEVQEEAPEEIRVLGMTDDQFFDLVKRHEEDYGGLMELHEYLGCSAKECNDRIGSKSF